MYFFYLFLLAIPFVISKPTYYEDEVYPYRSTSLDGVGIENLRDDLYSSVPYENEVQNPNSSNDLSRRLGLCNSDNVYSNNPEGVLLDHREVEPRCSDNEWVELSQQDPSLQGVWGLVEGGIRCKFFQA